MAGVRILTGGITGRLPRKGGGQRFAMTNARSDMARIIKEYESLIKALKGVTPQVVYDALKPIYDKSQMYVPKKTGALWQSGTLEVWADSNGKVHGEITYGQGIPYAAMVHEFTWLYHKPPTRSKFLQSAMEEELDNFLLDLADGYMAVMV